MSIRQHRIDTIEKMRTRIASLVGKKVTVVLNNSTSVLGELRSSDEHGLTLMNGRLRENRFPFSDIKELYFDEVV